MKFYVAGRFMHYKKVREIIDQLKFAGWECTHDWTRTDEFDEFGNPVIPADGTGVGAKDLPLEKQQEYAVNDLIGASDCDVLVLLGHDHLWGAMLEVGVTLAHGKQVWIIRHEMTRYSVFWALRNVRFFETEYELYQTAKLSLVA